MWLPLCLGFLLLAQAGAEVIRLGRVSRSFHATSSIAIGDFGDAASVDGREIVALTGLLAQAASPTSWTRTFVVSTRACLPGACAFAYGPGHVNISYTVSAAEYAAMRSRMLAQSFYTNGAFTIVGGTVSVRVAVYAVANGVDPIEVSELDQLRVLNNALVRAAGSDGAVAHSLDLCAERTCHGVGACPPDSGVCECVGDWWGVDCETPCACQNGGVCDGRGLCVCPYPFFGKDCGRRAHCHCGFVVSVA